VRYYIRKVDEVIDKVCCLEYWLGYSKQVEFCDNRANKVLGTANWKLGVCTSTKRRRDQKVRLCKSYLVKEYVNTCNGNANA
jgi:hypothetical protein